MLNTLPPPIGEPLIYLRGQIKALGRMGEKVTSRQRVAYEVERDFCEVKVLKDLIQVRVFDMGLPDPKGIVTDIPGSHEWQYEKQIPINSKALVDYAMIMPSASSLGRASRNGPRLTPSCLATSSWRSVWPGRNTPLSIAVFNC